LTRAAARLFAEKGYHGTSVGDLAGALGVQKGSLYSHIDSKADLLWEVAREGAKAFHAALDTVPDEGPVVERIRLALRAHLRVVAEQLDIATVFVREWRLLALSSANWAYTWLRPGADTDELADRFTALLLDGMRGYASR
jgi:AcrR family transcriptional regulator